MKLSARIFLHGAAALCFVGAFYLYLIESQYTKGFLIVGFVLELIGWLVLGLVWRRGNRR